MKVEALNESHLRRIKVREFERVDLGENIDDGQIQHFLSSQLGYALIDDEDQVVIVFGGVITEGYWNTWMLTSELMFKYPIASLKLIMRAHMDGVDQFGIKKFYTYNPADADRENQYLERIGYKAIGTCDDFDDKKERILFLKEVA